MPSLSLDRSPVAEADRVEALDLLRGVAVLLIEHVMRAVMSLAARIIDYREQHGPFRAPRDLLKVSGIGEKKGLPSSGPAVASSRAAESRTDRVTAWCADRPFHPSKCVGPSGTRPRDGLSPNTPQHDAGIRIEPPPSLACAIGSSRAATAAADPPDDPPLVSVRFQGLAVAP